MRPELLKSDSSNNAQKTNLHEVVGAPAFEGVHLQLDNSTVRYFNIAGNR